MRFGDRIQETTATTGTGTLTLAGAVTGFRAFSASFEDGDRVPYAIALGAQWEVGEGIYSAGTLTRENVLSSSNAGTLVDFSAGNKLVWVDVPAAAALAMGVALAFHNNNVPQ